MGVEPGDNFGQQLERLAPQLQRLLPVTERLTGLHVIPGESEEPGGTRWDPDSGHTVVSAQHLDNLFWGTIVACVVGAIMLATNMTERKRRRVLNRYRTNMLLEEQDRRPAGSAGQPLAELFLPPLSDLAPNVLAGAIAGLKFTLAMVVFSGIVYNAQEDEWLTQAFPEGINLNLMSCTGGLLMSAGLSGFNVVVAPQDIPAMLLSQVAGVLDNTIRCPNRLPHTVLACSWLSAVTFGAVAWLAGRFRAGRIMRSIPTPVVGGFISATGAMAVRSALSMLAGTPFHILWPTSLEPFRDVDVWTHLLAGLCSLVCIRYLGTWIKDSGRVKSDGARALVGPLCLLLPLMAFYAYLFVLGDMAGRLERMRAAKWVYPVISPRPFYQIWTETFPEDHHVQLVEWTALLDGDVLLLLVMLQVLSLISAVLNIIGAASAFPGGDAVDLDSELRILGLENLVIGALGGNVCYHQLGMSVNMRLDGGSHRLAELVAAGFVAAVFFSGLPVSCYVPKFFLAGIFMNLGLTFLSMHLAQKFRRMDRGSYCTMLAMVLVALAKDMTWAVATGITLQAAMLVVHSSTVDPVRLCEGTEAVASGQLRTAEERRLLRESRLIEVVHLQGPLFFGITPQLVLQVENVVRQVNPVPLHLVLCLERVTALDDSAAQAFLAIQRTAARQGTELCVAGAEEWRWLLSRQGLLRPAAEDDSKAALLEEAAGGEARWFGSLEEALLECEDNVLASLKGPSSRALVGLGGESEEHLQQMSGMPMEHWRALLQEGERLEYKRGDMLYCRGDPCEAVHLLLLGTVQLTAAGPDGGSARVHGLAVLGAEALLLQLASNAETALVASEGAEVLRLSHQCVEAMRRGKQELYISLAEMWGRALCSRSQILAPG